jgi:O-acetylserine/cysteine efflux transporter
VFLLHSHAAATVTPFALLIPVFGMASTAIAFGEALTPVTAVGSALVFHRSRRQHVFGGRLIRR